jgi:hypothetical protein
MRAIKTLRPNFRPQQNYDSDEENEVDYESDSSGSHNALLRDNHVQKSLANTDKVVAALFGTAFFLLLEPSTLATRKSKRRDQTTKLLRDRDMRIRQGGD